MVLPFMISKAPIQKEPANAEYDLAYARSRHVHLTDSKLYCNELSVDVRYEYMRFRITIFLEL